MKKSSLVFLFGNIFILTIPFLFIGALSHKITNKDYVDVKAEREARERASSIVSVLNPDINAIEMDGKLAYMELIINVNDSVNSITMDTSTARYVSFKTVGKRIVLQYDFVQDSIDNYRPLDTDEYYYLACHKKDIYISLTNTCTSAILKNVSLTMNLGLGKKLTEDINISCDNASFKVNSPKKTFRRKFELTNRHYRYEGEYAINDESNEDSVITYPAKFDKTLHLKLYNNSLFSSDMAYVKLLDLDMKNNTSINLYTQGNEEYEYEASESEYEPVNYQLGQEYGHINLKIDKSSNFFTNVNDLPKMTITYK